MYLCLVKIKIEPHTLVRANERGASEDEIINTLENGTDLVGKMGRMGKSKVFEFQMERNGLLYKEKKIDVYYVIEDGFIVTVTVYVFYGKF
jgi:hypothetical protein